ncbi:C6 finger domain-containing protein [Lasiodiplodia theobromae]|uniref:C6 finger domain-containing protein n=1 Tax=Lasiodiplodia theobromae TaxID=45133 RepID=UPI0015C3B834|nr:C6 finger domain-containing protein [Lasiodiplodia theobromae]KAF4546560.1 C6 finger domain-containing protein [Lasiodiplodia theobromae]
MSPMQMSDSDSPSPAKRSRRSHKKSRAGCRNCKRRRIKCDESKPGCQNCADFKIHCDFDPRRPAIVEPTSSPSPNTPVRRRRGRPRKGWDTISCASTATSSAAPSPAFGESASSPLPSALSTAQDIQTTGLNLADLELMHQYSVATFHELGHDAIGTMWRIAVPQLGFDHPCVLHNAMAFAAMHLAYLRPTRRAHYAALAAHHSTIGLQQTSDLLLHLARENCHAIYVSAVLVCFYVFAKGPSPGDFLVFGEHGPSEWLPLLKGVRCIIELFGHDVLWTGPLAAMGSGPRTASQPIAVKFRKPRVDWERPFDDLRQLVALSGHPDAQTYMNALEGLAQCYEGVFGKGPDAEYNGTTANQVHLGWLYRMEEQFVVCLHQKHPLALIILAYFSPLLKSMEPLWFMEGWAEHLIAGVHGFVDQSLWNWLQWPMDQVERAFTAQQVDVVLEG